jgi:dipeptidyl aminopeptidase/acylaminoacyl peptidase
MRVRLLAVAAIVTFLAPAHPVARRPAAQAPPSQPAASQAKDATITPGDNLVVEGLPPVPASIAEAVARYTEFRSAGFADWHPVRREMLISTRFGDVPQVHLVKAPGGARQQLTFFPDRVGGAAFEPKAGEYFVFGKDRGGDEFTQGYRYDLATGNVTMFTDGGRSQNGGGPWSTAGDRMAYSSTRRNGADRDVHVIDPRDPATDRRVLEVKGGGWQPVDWSPDDRTLLVAEYVSVNESYLWLVDLATGEKKLLTPKTGQPVSYGDAEFAADGRGVFVTTDKDNEFKRLARIDLATGAHTYYTSDVPWDVEGFDLSEDGKTIAFTTNEEGLDVLRLLDVATGRERPRPQLGLGPGVMGGLFWHRNGKDLAFTYNSAQSSTDVYSLDVTTGKVERWTESELGGLNAATFSPAELVGWKSFDGKTISGFLYKPPASFTGRRPVVINIHGGPEGQSVPSFLGRNNYDLNELGVAIVFPNVRGSTGFGKTFVALDNGMKREDSVKDIGALLDWVATRPDLDASRVMVTGGSYGGYMTLAVATHYNDRIRCALDVVGISNFVTFLQHTEAYRRDLRRVEYGDERDPAMRAFLEKISPMTSAAKITKPMFIVQGRNDPRVPYTESQQMVETIRRNNGAVWYLMANDEGHGFAKKRNQDFLFYATVMFMKQHLLN